MGLYRHAAYYLLNYQGNHSQMRRTRERLILADLRLVIVILLVTIIVVLIT